MTVASRRLTDSSAASRPGAAGRRPTPPWRGRPPPGGDEAIGGRAGERDDSLALLFLCCHPSLSPPSQVALTLAVGGLTTAEVARAFLVPATMGQRISRAKATVTAAGATFDLPPPEERSDRPPSSRSSTSCSTRATPPRRATTSCAWT